MTHPFGLLWQRNIILQYYVEHSMFIIRQIKCSWLLPHRQAICFSSLIWLSRNKSVKKSCFWRIVKNSREFSLLDLEAFWFHFSLLEKEWKHFDFTLHFLKKSESIFFSLCTSRTSKTHSRWSLLWIRCIRCWSCFQVHANSTLARRASWQDPHQVPAGVDALNIPIVLDIPNTLSIPIVPKSQTPSPSQSFSKSQTSSESQMFSQISSPSQ